MEILYLDLETCTKTLAKRKASPFCPDNYIVAAGWAIGNDDPDGDYYDKPSDKPIRLPSLDDVALIVGHNIKFDLLYLWDHPQIVDYIHRGGRIWDTQYAEYLIQGMVPSSHMNSLNDCAVKYGGNKKIDAVKEMWDQGINTPDIPEDLLMDYLLGNEELEGDIGNTRRVFLGQVKAIQSYPETFKPMLANRMESLLATTEMEWNGLYVDMVIGQALRDEVANEAAILTERMNQYLPEMPPECVFKWTSVYDKSYLIFGGVKKYEKWVQHTDPETGELLYCQTTEKWPLFDNEPTAPGDCILCPDSGLYRRKSDNAIQDTFKSGKRVGEGKVRNTSVPDLSRPKGAKKDHFFSFEGYTQPSKRWLSSLTDGKDGPIYSTSAEVIEKLGNRNVPFLQDLSKRAKLVKDLGTYYYEEDTEGNRSGMLTCVGPDGIIHHGLNHTSTVTSRMSSSNPNLQNLPRKGTSQVKKMFTSRFGDMGYIVEMDYSALEVYVQALLTGDEKMLQMLKDGIDFHCYRLAAKLGEDYEQVLLQCKDENHPEHKEYDFQRTAVKGFSFQLAYGAGAAAISEEIGLTEDEVKALMEMEKKLFPRVSEFDQKLEETIIANYQPGNKPLYVDGKQFLGGTGHWFSPTGTKYTWEEHEAPEFLWERGKYTGFSPTQRKNFPVQGTGGEVMQTMLGCLYRYFVANNNWGGKALLVNTVHDSVYLDIHKDVIHEVVPACVQILSAVRLKFNKDFPNIDFDGLDFKVDAEIGRSMYACKGYQPETIY